MKRENVDTFEKLKAQLDSLHQEMSILAKKSPNDAVNAFKIKLVNAALSRCNEFFGDRYRPFPEFDHFAEDELPSNSDITFIVSQYMECAEKFRADNIEEEFGSWYWRTTGKSGERMQTSSPKKLLNRN